jgi:hypothetical protein
MPSFGSAVPVPAMPVKRTTIHTNGHPQVPWTPNAVVWYSHPDAYHQTVLMTSTNLLDWRVVTNAPEDGKLRTNSVPASPQRFYWLVKVPTPTNNAQVLTLTNK